MPRWGREPSPVNLGAVPRADEKDEADVELLTIGGKQVRITHPGKPYFSREVKLSKLDVVRYFLAVADGALVGIRDRPIVLKRFVDGAEGEAFYQKRAPDKRPGWLRTVTLSFPSGRTAEEVVVDDAGTRLAAAFCRCTPADDPGWGHVSPDVPEFVPRG